MKINKQFLIALAILFASFNFCFGQVTFQKTFGLGNRSEANDGIQTTDGGYIFIGNVKDTWQINGDVALIKTNSYGDTLWTKVLRIANNNFGQNIKQTSDGGYIFTGSTSFIGSSQLRAAVTKTDSTGNILWTKVYGNAVIQGTIILQNPDGSYFVCANGDYGSRFSIFGLNASGDTLWVKYQPDSFVISTVTYASEIGNGEIIVAGYYRYNNTINLPTDCFLIKADTYGNIIWIKTYGNTVDDRANCVIKTNDGGFIVAGTTGTLPNMDIYVFKTDDNGNEIWSKTYGGTQFDEAFSIKQTNDGSFAIAGYTNSFGAGSLDAYLLKTDVGGNLLWSKAYGTTLYEEIQTLEQTSDGGYLLAGSLHFNYNPIISNAYLIKTDSLGNSGCNEINAVTSVNSFSTVTGSGLPMLAPWFNFIVDSVTTVVSGGIDFTLCPTTGVTEQNYFRSLSLSPNPTNGNFTITFPSTITKGTIEIINTMGTKIFSQTISNTSTANIQLKNIVAGIYFVKVTGNEKYYFQKVIVE